MEESESKNEADRLLSAIIEQAEGEAKKRLEEADRQAQEIISAARQQAATFREQHLRELEKEADTKKLYFQQTLERERRRRELKVREELINYAFERVKEELESRIGQKDYPIVLKAWIEEAVLGLRREHLYVNGSKVERSLITPALLGEVEKEVYESTGLHTKLELSPDPPLQRQGVVLRSEDARVAYDNSVEARLRRFEGRLRRMVYRRIQQDTQQASEA